MNAVEIEQAVSEPAEQPFDSEEFPYAFLTAFGNKDTTIKRLRSGASNKSDVGGVLQTNNIHIKTCDAGQVAATLDDLRASQTTTRSKAKFILATDGIDLEAEDIMTGETIACRYTDFPDHFGFFLPLAGISTVKQIHKSAFGCLASARVSDMPKLSAQIMNTLDGDARFIKRKSSRAWQAAFRGDRRWISRNNQMHNSSLGPYMARSGLSERVRRSLTTLDIELRLTPPKSPQTNGMIERFNGRIKEVLQGHHFRSGEELETTQHRYFWLYYQQLQQTSLGSKTPLHAMKG